MHAIEMSRAGVPPFVIQLQLGHAELRIASLWQRAMDNVTRSRTGRANYPAAQGLALIR